MKKVLIIFSLWFVLINLFALLANNRVNLQADTAYTWINPEYTYQVQSWNVTRNHNRWDSHYFLGIASSGYSYTENELSNIAFFPLYPFLTRLLGTIFNFSFIFAGWMISSFSTLFSAIFIYKLAKEFHSESDPYLAVFLFLIFPTAFVLNAVYSEALFIFLSIACFYYMRKNNFLVASILGFLASLTRFTGILLLVPLAIEFIRSTKGRIKPLKACPMILVPLGTITYFAYLKYKFGNFLLYFEVQKLWGRGFTLNLEHFNLVNNPAIVNFAFDLFFAILGLIMIFLVSKKLRLSYGLYILVTMFVALSSGTTMSIGRIILTLFPISIYGSTLKDKICTHFWIFTSSILLALYTLLFVAHYWAG